jgi:hypothetical protein
MEKLPMAFRTTIVPVLTLILSLVSPGLLAKGPELKFTSIVTAVDQTNAESGIVSISIQGLELPVVVNSDTEIEYQGELADIAAIAAGDLLKVEVFFADGGLIAEEVQILQTRFQQFRLRGVITALDVVGDTTFLTIAGVEVRADAGTVVVPRHPGAAGSLSALQAGDEISVNGRLEEGTMQARQIHTGERSHGEIEFDGTLQAITASSAIVRLMNGVEVLVVIDGNTRLRGTPTAGDFVEFEGYFDSALNLIAVKLAPDDDGDQDADDDFPDDNGSTPGDDIELGTEVALLAVNSSLSGKVETRYRDRAGNVDQKLEVEVEDSAPGITYALKVHFADQVVDFGTLTSNQFGEASVEFEVDDNVTGLDLAPLLPAGKSVLDVDAVEVLLNGEIVLVGNLTGNYTPSDSQGGNDDDSTNGSGDDNSTGGDDSGDDNSTGGDDSGDDNSGDDSAGNGGDDLLVESFTLLTSTGGGVNGDANTRYRRIDGTVDQKFQVEIEDAPAATTYSVRVFFGAEAVDFGTLVTDALGEAEAEYEVDDEISDRPLAPLLPAGSSVLDITSVQILQGDTVVAAGTF